MIEFFGEFLRTLDRTERLPPRELARYQQDLLIRLVRHAHAESPFYRDRLSVLFTADGNVDLRQWNSVPLLAREDAIAHGREMRVASLPPLYGDISEGRTSGSTGVPLPIVTNGLQFVVANALLTRSVRRFGVATSGPLAIIDRFPDDPVPPYPEGGYGKGWSFADPAAPYYKLEVLAPVDQQIEWLARRKAPYVLTVPSGALAIVHAVTPAQGRALGIEAVILIGETVSEEARELIAERLGARPIAIYACREVGHIGSQCEAAPHYHMAAENVLVEILDDEGRDVVPGRRGRVVLTGLYNYAMPFIRYEIGDIALAGIGPCSCGRTLPVIERIEGRTRNMFIFRDGTRFWPRYSTVRPMQAFVPFHRYQLAQLDYERIELRYIPDGSGREPDVAALNAYARQAIHPSIDVSPIAVDALQASPSGKIEEFISYVAAARPSRA
jgi:phenylacetate-CoA ligase